MGLIALVHWYNEYVSVVLEVGQSVERASARIFKYGTDETVEGLRRAEVGALSFLYSSDGLRRISWNNVELVRAIAWPIRDENWGTYPVSVISESVAGDDGFALDIAFTVGDGRLRCDLGIRADATGVLQADLDMTPVNGVFSTNRAGFTVLHPINPIAGSALTILHSDGSSERSSFPELIRPDQPARDIRSLSYGVDGQSVEIAFAGETFEMEDQRNWSDASFKTYCVPLVHPFTYEIAQTTRQSITVRLTGKPTQQGADARRTGLAFEKTSGVAPDIGVALESGWLPRREAPEIPGSYCVLRTAPGAEDAAALAEHASRYPSFDLEIRLPDDGVVEDGLRATAELLSEQGLVPARVIALPESYLGSHQPVGPWPDGPTPNDVLARVREVFPASSVGGGMLTNFTEVNRCRPDPLRCDYVTHGLTAIVHAGDDMSVLETLETLPHIFASAAALSDGLPYRLGLCAIGMRSNPYGAAVAANPDQVRRTMARIDPRHRGVFGACFAVGLLAATQGTPVRSLCLGAPVGPFGLVYDPMGYPQDGYDGSDRAVYPIYHVAQEASEMAGRRRLDLQGLPDGVIGYGVETEGRRRMMIANIGDKASDLELPGTGHALCLDVESFDAATRNADWLVTSDRVQTKTLDLPPLSIAFVDFPR